jgi:hypothetical protein
MATIPQMIDSYLAGVQTLRLAVAGMSAEQLRARPVAGKWSTLEVVCHLADSDQSWAHRMKRVIAEDRPLFIGYDETRFVNALACHSRNLEDELGFIDQTRRQMAFILRSLPSTFFARDGVHSERGLVTLEQMLQIEVDHIPHHVRLVQEKRRALGLPG